MKNAASTFRRFTWSVSFSLALHAFVLFFVGQTIRDDTGSGRVSSPSTRNYSVPLFLEVGFTSSGHKSLLASAYPEQDSTRYSPPALPAEPATMPPQESGGGGETGSVLPMAQAIYIPANLLDAKPRIIRDIPSDFAELNAYPEGGKLSLTLWIGAGGNVDMVSAGESSLPALFVELASKAFYSAKFSPGKIGDTNIGTILNIEVEFQPLGDPSHVNDKVPSATEN